MWSLGKANFKSRAINWTNVFGVHLTVFWYKSKWSVPSSFREDNFQWSRYSHGRVDYKSGKKKKWIVFEEVPYRLLQAKYMKSRACGFRKKIFRGFISYNYRISRAVGKIIWVITVRVNPTLLHHKYLSSRTYSFKQEYFKGFPKISQCIRSDSRGRVVFDPKIII